MKKRCKQISKIDFIISIGKNVSRLRGITVEYLLGVGEMMGLLLDAKTES